MHMQCRRCHEELWAIGYYRYPIMQISRCMRICMPPLIHRAGSGRIGYYCCCFIEHFRAALRVGGPPGGTRGIGGQ